MPRVGLIGAGGIGNVHAASCLNLPDVTMTWIADLDKPRAEALAVASGARVTTEANELVSADDVDAVIVATPTPTHRALTELAARHGKHVFCEKPIARTVADGRAMIATCQQAGVRFMVGHVVRFFPDYARIKQLLEDGALGQVGVVRAARLNAFPAADRPGYADFAASGGVVVDMMIHDLDTLRWYFGDVVRLYARGLGYTPYYARQVDYCQAVVRYANGVLAHIEASWAHASFRTSIELAGSAGLIQHASAETNALRVERTGKTEAIPLPHAPVAEPPHQTELRHFLAGLGSTEPYRVTGDDALIALETSLAVLESVRTGQAITFSNGHPLLEEETA
jgi:UDP-N-acetylglucosamine 3-dehydrogenase